MTADDVDGAVDEDLPPGEDAGECDADPGDPFFVSKSAAAILKHGILKRYIVPFTSKVGSTAKDKRVLVLDGYAGPGVYEDGTEGSPALLAESAKTVAAFRKVECHFVEQKRKSFKALTDYLAAEGDGLQYQLYRGTVQKHLPTIIENAAGQPLFAYLDPFGFGIPFDDVVALLKRYTGQYDPPTEVLLNFTANGIRRVGALLYRPLSLAEQKSVERADAACGGTWWRDEFLRHAELDEAVEGVTNEYMRRVCKAAGAAGFSLPVKKREHHKPVYYLIFFTRHRDGMWLFNQAVSSASEEWRAACAPPPAPPATDALFEVEDPFVAEERKRVAGWIATIEANITDLLASGPFVVGAKMIKVYGDTLGEARETHVKTAIKNLYKAKVTSTTGVGDIQSMRVDPV